jgi:S-adenosylmethionine synthetase
VSLSHHDSGLDAAIGVAEPVSVSIDMSRTGKLSDDRLARAIGEVFDLRPGAFRSQLNLHRPIYRPTAAYGHFGRSDLDLSWDRPDRIGQLREAAGC